jgi:hypothetical protein
MTDLSTLVRPLVWVKTQALRKHLVEGEDVIEMATRGGFLYTLRKNYQIGMSWSAYRGRTSPVQNGTCVSLVAAKAAAQADYAARILAALDPGAVAKIREDAMREVLEAIPTPPKIVVEHSHEHGEATAIHCVRKIILALIDKKDTAK